MDNRNQRQQKARQERLRALRFQRAVRAGAIILALVLAIIALAQSCSTKKAINDLAAQLKAKKLAQAQQEILAAQASPSPSPSPSPLPQQGLQVTLSFGGEVAMGSDDTLTDGGRFAEYYAEYGPDYFFQNVKSIFEGDDLTTVSLTSPLTLSADTRDNWDEAYRGEPEYGAILAQSGIDAAAVANAHSYDYGYEGYVDTLANLDNSQVDRFAYDSVLLRSVTGHSAADPSQTGAVTVGYAAVYENSENDYTEMALQDIAELRSAGAQLVVVEVSWTSESADVPDESQILLAHKLIDAGADLVVGIQPEVLQGIELYQGKYIVYSLGTLLSGSPTLGSADALIFQQTFTVSGGAALPQGDFTLIPCSLDASEGGGLCPTPAEGDQAQQILSHIYDCSAELSGGISPQE